MKKIKKSENVYVFVEEMSNNTYTIERTAKYPYEIYLTHPTLNNNIPILIGVYEHQKDCNTSFQNYILNFENGKNLDDTGLKSYIEPFD